MSVIFITVFLMPCSRCTINVCRGNDCTFEWSCCDMGSLDAFRLKTDRDCWASQLGGDWQRQGWKIHPRQNQSDGQGSSSRTVQERLSATRPCWRATVTGWSKGVWGYMELCFFFFFIILGPVLGCNWSVRADGSFELGLLMSLLCQLGGCRGPLCLARVSTAQLRLLPKRVLYRDQIFPPRSNF